MGSCIYTRTQDLRLCCIFFEPILKLGKKKCLYPEGSTETFGLLKKKKAIKI